MTKLKRHEIELTPKLLKRLLEHVRNPNVGVEELDSIIENLCVLTKSFDPITVEEFDLIIKKPMAV